MADSFSQMMAGLGALAGSMKEFAQTRAISHAQDEINQLNTIEMDDMKKRQQQQLIAQNLTMNLAKVGGDLRAAAAIMPQQLDTTDNWLTTGRQLGLDEKQKDRDLEWKKALLGVSKAAQKKDAKDGEVALTQLDKFRQHPPVSKIYESLEAGSQLGALIKQDTPLADAAARYKFAKLAQGAGVLSDTDLANLSGDPSLWGSTVRKIHRGLYGTLPKSEKIDYQGAATALIDRAKSRLRDEGEKFANSRSAYLTDPDTFRSSIRQLIDSDTTGAQSKEEPGAKPSPRAMKHIRKPGS